MGTAICATKGKPELAYRRSDLLTASSDSRVAEETNNLQLSFDNYAATGTTADSAAWINKAMMAK